MHWELCLYYMSNPITKYVINRERFTGKGMSTPLADSPFVSSNIQYKIQTFSLTFEIHYGIMEEFVEKKPVICLKYFKPISK